ncbi:putative quinol monooxygenase [Azospirillum sp. HJ39]|uniref:putative quinol monooxygenase n=1 Tax=Azospirillum sp. HJ39 TaxID=3159496 RepID=UPI0035581450
MSLPPNDQVQLVAYLVATEGEEQALANAIADIVPAVLEEPGCLGYAAHVIRDVPGTVVMYEVWENRAALDAHLSGANFASLSALFKTLLSEPPRIDLLRRIA